MLPLTHRFNVCQYCGCDPHCGNRVVQHPRDIGIEIFDTNRYGWGVRALKGISQGKVLGTYTGYYYIFVCYTVANMVIGSRRMVMYV